MPVVNKLVNNVSHSAKDYLLRSKSGRRAIADFCIGNCEIPKGTNTYTYVNVGKKSEDSFSKEIIAFFDEAGKLIQHVFRTNGENTAKRNYLYPKKDIRIIDFFSDNGKKVASELQKIRICDDNKKQLLTKRVNYLQDKNKNSIQEIIFTHFPKFGNQKTGSKLVASAKVIEREGQKVLTDFQKSGFGTTFDISNNDRYLLFRFLGLNTDEGLFELTKRFLKEKQILKLKLNIRISPRFIDENTEGGFSVMQREISYSSKLKEKSPLQVVNTVAHEVEHAYQYSQIGRMGKGRTSYESDAHRLLGDLKCKDVPEAIKYADARYNYPIIKPGEDLSKNERYLTNYLEVKAREAGKNAEDRYMHSNPQNYLFFDWAYNS